MDSGQSLIEHLRELRSRVLRALGAAALLTLFLFPFRNQLYHLIAVPLVERLPEGQHLIATDVTTPLMAPLKLIIVLAIVLAAPFILYQLWAFVAPGLYANERSVARLVLGASVFLFYCGLLFAYFAVFPLVFAFLAAIQIDSVQLLPDAYAYLNLCLNLFLAFGAAFQVPVVVFVVTRLGLISIQELAAARSYVFLGAFVIGMLLTPPDIVSQTMLAVPIWLLFEAGVLLCRFLENPNEEEN